MSNDRKVGRERGATVYWSRIGAVLLILAALVAGWKFDVVARASDWIDSWGHEEAPPWMLVPESLSEGDIEQQRDRLTADRAFEVEDSGRVLRAFAWEESDGNWTFVFYRRDADGFSRFGSLAHPSGFDTPRLVGDPPSLRMRNRNLGIDFVLRVEDDDVSILPPGAIRVEP